MIKVRHCLLILLSFGLALLLSGCDMAMLNPKGMIAADEMQLMITAVVLMLFVVVPVILLSFAIAWRYRASNKKAAYTPNWSHSTSLEIIWWTIPCIIILILGVITWTSSYRLDPYKPLAVKGEPLVVQAIALDWKWLFIYPELEIATLNYVQLPVNVPVTFHVSAEGPMNSFHIPQLSGQIYAMAGMQTKLNLIANETGEYKGLSANYSGRGFSDMKFTVKATSAEEFKQWVATIKQSPNRLTTDAYNALAKPSENEPVKYFSSPTKYLFETVVMKSMLPAKDNRNLCSPALSTNVQTKLD